MNTNPNYALYYPSIEFQNSHWLWMASLLWDKIYRIVPKDYNPKDLKKVQELMSEGDIGIPIHPDAYVHDIAEEFIDKLNNSGWNAAALPTRSQIDREYAKLHKDKIDVKLKEMIIAEGNGALHDDWLFMDDDFAALYMTYLAKSISEKIIYVL